MAAAAAELLVAGSGLGEPEFAVRGGQLRVPRLGRVPAALAGPGTGGADGGWRLDFTERGSLGNLVLARTPTGAARSVPARCGSASAPPG